MEDIAPGWMSGIGMWVVDFWLEVRNMVRRSCFGKGNVGLLEDEKR